MLVGELIDELKAKCSKNINVRVLIKGKYYYFDKVEVEYETNDEHGYKSSEVFATLNCDYYDLEEIEELIIIEKPKKPSIIENPIDRYHKLRKAIVKVVAEMKRCDDSIIGRLETLDACRAIMVEAYGSKLNDDVYEYLGIEKNKN